MVGVPGRSKGCHACRKRKIACSQERPECLICRNANRQCPGYERERIFIHHDSHATKRTKAKKNRQDQALPTESKTKSASLDLDSVFNSAMSQCLTKTAFKQCVFAGLAPKVQLKHSKGMPTHDNWLAKLTTMSFATPSLENFALAFCTARMGRRNRDNDLVRYSLQMYTQGLRDLQKDLWDPKMMYNDQVLGACILCTFYEVFECPGNDSKGYQSHFNGCAKLIQARGPEAHISGLGHSIFSAFRLTGAIQGLAERHTFLAEPEWMTIPFSEGPKDPVQLLIDILLEAPQLLNAGDSLKFIEDPSEQLKKAIALWRACWDHYTRLEDFYTQYAQWYPSDELYWEESSTSRVLPAMPFAQFDFVDFMAARVLNLYWAMKVMLLSGMHHLRPVLLAFLGLFEAGAAGFNISTEEATIIRMDVEDFRTSVRRIFQSVDYFLQEKYVDLAPAILLAPVNIVYYTVRDWPDCTSDTATALAVLSCIEKQNVRIVQHLHEKVPTEGNLTS